MVHYLTMSIPNIGNRGVSTLPCIHFSLSLQPITLTTKKASKHFAVAICIASCQRGRTNTLHRTDLSLPRREIPPYLQVTN